jgi:pimeloyl-ACP methyl ester carboxylesterase
VSRDHSFLSLGPNGFHRIAYSEWGSAMNQRVVVCVHGLTRNRRDFDYVAAHLADSFRVVSVDMPGRGDSDWLKAKEDYRFSQYQADCAALIARVTAPALRGFAWLRGRARANSAQVDWIGTSMGGIIGMMLAAQPGSPIRRLVLNDVGPLVPWSGLIGLKGYVGRDNRFASAEDAERWAREVFVHWGALTDEQVRHLARHSVHELEGGGFGLRYDPSSVNMFRRRSDIDLPLGPRFFEGLDLWQTWDAIRARTLVLRGANSDLLLPNTVEEMKTRGPRAEVVEFPGVGHAPSLMLPDQMAPIREFLLRD